MNPVKKTLTFVKIRTEIVQNKIYKESKEIERRRQDKNIQIQNKIDIFVNTTERIFFKSLD